MRELVFFVLLVPRNIGVLVLRAYRAAISPLYGDVCRYHPSCSAYGLGSVQQRGLLIGAALTAWRIVRCNPWSAGGIDDVRPARHSRYGVTASGWVLPSAWVTVPERSRGGNDASPELVSSSPDTSRKD
ncbi:membrane protein insertion efficiency factor YidD [Microbacterium sp.]|uniref:membrane protein insertion efficiency factor YidD n=1 Tax=Microbacterium sp. TaxID=51671 RepID=UPI002811166B|nr:membrane protein insertion efficiency factor YidD [Microbacterium sp.]